MVLLTVGHYPKVDQIHADIADVLAGGASTDTTIHGIRVVTMQSTLGDCTRYTALFVDEAPKAFASLELTPYPELTDWNNHKTAELLVALLRKS